MSARAAAIPRPAEPNITPLIDIMLVLLIIFMASPWTRPVLDTALPAPPSSLPQPHTTVRALVISVRADDLELDGRRYATGAELASHLSDLLATRRDRTIFVRAVADVPYQRVVTAIDAARGAGAARIGLVGNDRRPPRAD